jgi:hypothetical protein
MTTPADFEIPPLQLRRGTDTAIMAYQAAAGEPIWTVDTQEFRIGDGSTPGGFLVNGSGPTGATGYTGSRGATGQSSNYYRYKAKTGTTSGNPGAGFLIWNTSTQRNATQINLSHLDNDSNDIDVFLALLNAGDTVIVQDQSNSDNYQIWNVSTTATVYANSYVEVPVTLTSSTGTGYTGFANNHDLLFIIQSAGVQGPIGYTGSAGSQGYTGSQGSTGYTGSVGSTGTVGYTGSAGYAGSAGGTGSDGTAGVALGTWLYDYRSYPTINDNYFQVNNSDLTLATEATISETNSMSGPPAHPTNITYIWDALANVSNPIKGQLIIDNIGAIFNITSVSTSTATGGYYSRILGIDWIGGATGYGVNSNHSFSLVMNGAQGYTGSAGVGYTGSKGDAGTTGYTGSQGSIGYTGSAGVSADQTLNTTDNVVFNSVKSTQTLSAGGYPLDSNGQALISTNNTQSVALVVSNYTSGIRSTLAIRGYGQNLPNGTSSTGGSPGIFFDSSRGTMTSPTAVVSGDVLGVLTMGGYDGTNWLNASQGSNLTSNPPMQIVGIAAENFVGNATTVTNAGARLLMRLQPAYTQLNATSRQMFLNTTWTTSTTNPSTLNMNWGVGDSTTPTLLSPSGATSYTGYGATSMNWINSKHFIVGVTLNDTAPDNATLTGTNVIAIFGNRRSGVSGRRNPMQVGDNVAGMAAYGQTATSSTGIGGLIGRQGWTALENYSGSVRGSSWGVTSVNSGTNTESTRLLLDNLTNKYNSDSHQFYKADGTTNIASFATTSTSLYDSGSQYALINRDVHKVWSDQHILHNKAQDKQFASFENSQVVLSPNGTSVATFTTATITLNAPIVVPSTSMSKGQYTTGMNVGSTTYTLFQFDQSEYSGGKFLIKINDGADRHMVEMLVTGDGTNTTYNEYAVVTNNGDLGTFDAITVSGIISVRFTTKAGISNANARVSATLLV